MASRWFDNSRWLFIALSMVGVGYVFVGAWLVTVGPSDPITRTAEFLEFLVTPWMMAAYALALALIAFGIWYLRTSPDRAADALDVEAAMKRQAIRLTVILLVVAASLVSIGVLYFTDLKSASRAERAAQQESVARLKAQQIDKWLLERTIVAELLATSLRGLPLERLLSDRDAEQTVQPLFAEVLAGDTERTAVSLIAPDGRVLAHVGEGSVPDKETAKAALAVVTNPEPRLTIVDVHLDGAPPRPRMVFLVPITARSGSPPTIAVLAMAVDPFQGLFPQIVAWPTPSPSSEAVVVRREGDDVVFITPPPLIKPAPAPLAFRVPLAGSKMPSAEAVVAGDGVRTGFDYRGEEVLTASRRVSGVPWTVIAKTDLKEIAGRLQQKKLTLTVVIGAAIVLAAIMLVVLWRAEYASLLGVRAQRSDEQAAMAQHFAQLTRLSRDIILLTGPDGSIVEGNEAALTAYGYSAEELRGLNIRDLQAQEALPNADRRQAETVHRRKNGATFPVEITGRAFDVDGKRYRQSFVRDISHRKEMEKELQRVLRLLRTLRVANSTLLRAQTETELYQGMCDAIVAVGGYRMATIEIADRDEGGTIRQVAFAAVNADGPIEAATGPGDGSSGHGLTESVTRVDATKAERDFEGTPGLDFWRAAAIRRGDRSIVSLPLRNSHRIFGVLTLYASQPDAYNTSMEEVSLLKDFADDISYGVSALRARAAASSN